MTVSLSRQIGCVEREIAMRKRVYPRLVAAGKMRAAMASFEIGDMEAVLETLRWLQENGKAGRDAGVLRVAIQRIDGINDNPAHYNSEINAVCDEILRPHLIEAP